MTQSIISLPVTVIVHTRNEEKRLPWALQSVKPWAQEIIVCDMESTDKTLEIAQRMGARVLKVPYSGFVETARQMAIDAATQPWIFLLDADEMVSFKLYKTIQKWITEDQWDVIKIPGLNYFFGTPLQGNGWQPQIDAHFRLFRKGYLTWPPLIHAQPIIPENARILLDLSTSPMIHFNYTTVEHFLEKLNRYTSIEAELLFSGQKSGPKTFLPELAFLLKEFLRRFFYHKGYRDGRVGFYLSLLMVAYWVSVFSKRYLLKQSQGIPPQEWVEARYTKVAEGVLRDYQVLK